jgi:hypothetical protein
MTVQATNKKSVFTTLGGDTYNLINLIFAGIILCIFIYSAVFSPLKINYPIVSFHDAVTGQKSISTGLSRGFSCIMRGQFHDASDFNIFSIRLFIFFLVQLILRCTFILISWKKSGRGRNCVVITDIATSIILFVTFFFPFLKDIFSF